MASIHLMRGFGLLGSQVPAHVASRGLVGLDPKLQELRGWRFFRS